MGSQQVRKPWVLVPAGPAGWASHGDILPQLIRVWKNLRVHIEPVWFPRPRLEKAWLDRMKTEASCLIFPLGISQYDGLWLLSRLRLEHGLRIPAVIMIASDLTKGFRGLFDYRYAISRDDIFVTNCEAEKLLVREALGQQTHVHVIPLPVADVFFNSKKPESLCRQKKKLGFKSDDFLIVYCGRVSAQKNVHGLITSFAEVYRKNPNALLAIYGGADDIGLTHFPGRRNKRYIHELCAQITALKLENRVLFKGSVDQKNLADVLSVCSAHVSMTLHSGEDFGYAIAQGLAAGAPTVVTGWGGGLDFIAGRAAEPVPVTISANGPRPDYLAAQKALLKLARAGEKTKWAKRARRFAKRELSVQAVTSRWKTILSRPIAEVGGLGLAANKAFLGAYLNFCALAVKGRDVFVFKSASDKLYLKIARLYSGSRSQVPFRANQVMYLHPHFFPRHGIFDDAAVPSNRVYLTSKAKKELARQFDRNWKLVRWARLKKYDWAPKLVRLGVLLTASNHERDIPRP